jgi:hypothetical protein
VATPVSWPSTAQTVDRSALTQQGVLLFSPGSWLTRASQFAALCSVYCTIVREQIIF